MSTSASNPYANTLRALFAAKITPPASYKSRVTAQLVLGVILCFTLSLFLILSIRNRLRAGRKFRLLYLQQVSEGRIVVIDTLAFSGIFAWLGTIGLTVSLVYRYRKYVLGQEIPWQVGVLLFVVIAVGFMQGFSYVFSNVAATIQIMRKGRSFASISRTMIIVHNTAFVGLIVLFYGGTIPSVYFLMSLSHKANITAAALVTALQQAAALYTADSALVPQSLTDSIISLQADLGKVAADSLTAKTVWLSISIAAVAILAIGSAASLLFVRMLRRQTRWYLNQPITQSIQVSVQHQTAVQGDKIIELENKTLPATLPTLAFSSHPVVSHDFTPSTSKAFRRADTPALGAKIGLGANTSAAMDSGTAAIIRLCNDLSFGVPIALCQCLFFTALGVYAITATDKTSWMYAEITTDGFYWCYLLTFNTVIALFLYNLWRDPASHIRSGQTTSNDLPSRSGGRGKTGSATEGRRLSMELSSTRPRDIRVDAFYPCRDGFNTKTTALVSQSEKDDSKAGIFDIVRLADDRVEEGYAKYDRK